MIFEFFQMIKGYDQTLLIFYFYFLKQAKQHSLRSCRTREWFKFITCTNCASIQVINLLVK